MFHEDAYFDYLAHERRLSPQTLAAYRNDMAQFLAHCVDNECLSSVAELRHLHIRSWVLRLMEAGQSPRSVNRRLSCLKTYFKFLRKRGLLAQDPMKKVVAPKTGKRLPHYLQEHEMAALFTHVDFAPDYPGQRARLLLEILYATGMRRSELSALKLGDIDGQRMTFRVRGKGDKMRIVPYAPFLGKLMDAYLALRQASFPGNAEPWLFLNRKGEQLSPQSIYAIVHQHLSLVTNAQQRSPHVLRHSFATHLSNGGADLNAIKTLLGHANLAATQVYMHNSIERLQKVYEQAHPKGAEEDE
jgi:integrase/recombinase XerC